MRAPNFKTARPSPVNLTAMIDVVFLLIVFFTATNTMVRNEYTDDLDLPVATQGKALESNRSKKKITANILPNEEAYIAGILMTPQRFQELLQAELKQHPADHLEVQLRADRMTPYRAVEPLLLVCARSGVWQVSFAVREPEIPTM